MGLYGIEKYVGQDFNGEPLVNRAAGSVDIMLKSRAPVHVCEQQPWYRGETAWPRKYVRGRRSASVVDVGSAIVGGDQDSFLVR